MYENLKIRLWWPFYVALVLVGFGVFQGVALARGEPGALGFTAGTFSESWAVWNAAFPALWWIITIGLVLFTIWFPPHLRRAWPWEQPAQRPGDVERD